ncbi:MAG: hypothetical protein LLG14_01785 [Nocardiaceae bacterium]|nr:hypothetical protein [Nocardiaceae bacterium]
MSIRAALALLGAALLVSGCGSGDSSNVSATTSGESAPTGVLKISTVDAHGKPVASVEVEIERALDCDMTRKAISPGTSFTNHFSGTTDKAGKVELKELPLGCYNISVDDPAGGQLAAGSPHAAFLTDVEPKQSLELKFGSSGHGSGGECDPKEISEDLDIPDEQKNAQATIVECEPNWSIISWDVPGDSQRAVRVFGDKWVTYVKFPTDRCWQQARHDGAPKSFQKYFQSC